MLGAVTELEALGRAAEDRPQPEAGGGRPQPGGGGESMIGVKGLESDGCSVRHVPYEAPGDADRTTAGLLCGPPAPDP